MKDLIKKQEEKFKRVLFDCVCITKNGKCDRTQESNLYVDVENLKQFLNEARKETAELVCDKMIGKKLKNHFLSWNDRILIERKTKQQILKDL